MYLFKAQGVVKGNLVRNNYINSYNGGIGAYYTKLRIEGNTISFNQAGRSRLLGGEGPFDRLRTGLVMSGESLSESVFRRQGTLVEY